jgi:hypothetical protein
MEVFIELKYLNIRAKIKYIKKISVRALSLIETMCLVFFKFQIVLIKTTKSLIIP